MDVHSSAGGVMALIVLSTAMGNDPKNSDKNKKELLKICLKNPELKKLWNAPAPSINSSSGEDTKETGEDSAQ